MKERQYHITAINNLSGEREAISHPMALTQCQERLQRERDNRRHQRYQAHSRLRIEEVLPVQLTLNFTEDE